jgi:hypothetical protein
MRAVRPLVVALATLVGGTACDRLPTDVQPPPAPSSASTGLLPCLAPLDESMTQGIVRNGETISLGSHCVQRTFTLQAHRSNYAVAW